MKTILILGANSDVAKECIKLYVKKGYYVIAASRSTEELKTFSINNAIPDEKMAIRYFDATAFDTHEDFYRQLPAKPYIVLYAAGFQVTNDQALTDWDVYRVLKSLPESLVAKLP